MLFRSLRFFRWDQPPCGRSPSRRAPAGGRRLPAYPRLFRSGRSPSGRSPSRRALAGWRRLPRLILPPLIEADLPKGGARRAVGESSGGRIKRGSRRQPASALRLGLLPLGDRPDQNKRGYAGSRRPPAGALRPGLLPLGDWSARKKQDYARSWRELTSLSNKHKNKEKRP